MALVEGCFYVSGTPFVFQNVYVIWELLIKSLVGTYNGFMESSKYYQESIYIHALLYT